MRRRADVGIDPGYLRGVAMGPAGLQLVLDLGRALAPEELARLVAR